MSLLSTLVAFVVALGVLIAFHEFGHFLAARLCGVRVLRFCLGFGRPVWMRRYGKDGTEWAIAAIPLGGYVKLFGHDPEDEVAPGEAHRAFNRRPLAARAFIIAAGPLANFLLAIALYWGLNLAGVEEPPAWLGRPAAGSAAERAGVIPGDRVAAVDGKAIVSWNDLHWTLLRAAEAGAVARLEVRRHGGEIAFLAMDFGRQGGAPDLDGDFMKALGMTLFRPPPRIVETEPDSPAARGGLRAGDVVVAVAGRAIASGDEFVAAMRASPGSRLSIDVRRDGAALSLHVTPAPVDADGGRVGRIGARISDRAAPVLVRYGALDGLTRSLGQTWDMSVFSLKMLGRMVLGDVSWRNLSGPVTIADYAGKTARLGLTYYLNFLALVSISLGVLNLLPIPLLDGGHLLYYLLEFLRGKPVPEKVAEFGTRVGFAIVITTMAVALYNDIHRLLAG
ncbi:MAG: RIP metalloprotease RseP [Burkholderiales bacterium]|nr:RIP metalloprotease RseP [Burkholderiales bacterium]